MWNIRRLRQAHAARDGFAAQRDQFQERERARIVAVVRDSLGQQLVIIKNRTPLGAEQTPDDLDPPARYSQSCSRIGPSCLVMLRHAIADR